MSIEVNSTTHEWIANETVAGLLARLRYIYPMVIVKVNGIVIPRSRHDTEQIPDGSTVEVMHIESGG
jgi:thiamine biosynthesis protein ThiS